MKSGTPIWMAISEYSLRRIEHEKAVSVSNKGPEAMLGLLYENYR